jgi:diguanylate cyclase (GGDEF)-like protein
MTEPQQAWIRNTTSPQPPIEGRSSASALIAVALVATAIGWGSHLLAATLGAPSEGLTDRLVLTGLLLVGLASIAIILVRAARDRAWRRDLLAGELAADPLRALQRRGAGRLAPDLLTEVLSTVADGVRARDAELVRRTRRDPLTGFGNRASLRDQLRAALSRLRRRPGEHVALLIINLDRFASVNDQVGTAGGDAWLKAAARRIRACIRDTDFVARLGGDEFAVVAEDVGEGSELLGSRIAAALRQPIRVAGHEIARSASIGISEAHTGEERSDGLMHEADLAMFEAKRRGGDQPRLYVPEPRTQTDPLPDLARELDRALSGGELTVHYQPAVDLLTGDFRGMEALVRWNHPTRGLLSPHSFIAVAQESGRIATIDGQVLRLALHDMRRWLDAHPELHDLTVAVNVALPELAARRFVDDVRAALEDANVSPERLVIEISEPAMLAHAGSLAPKLAELRQLGVRIAIDDFGTGIAPQDYIRTLPVDVVKIDRSFIDGVNTRHDLATLVSTVLELSDSFGFDVVAEGVEDLADARTLSELGCRTAQGFALYQPANRHEIDRLLDRSEERAAA